MPSGIGKVTEALDKALNIMLLHDGTIQERLGAGCRDLAFGMPHNAANDPWHVNFPDLVTHDHWISIHERMTRLDHPELGSCMASALSMSTDEARDTIREIRDLEFWCRKAFMSEAQSSEPSP